MSTVFLLSYIVLSVLIVTEAVLINSIFKRVLKYQETVDQKIKRAWGGLLPGSQAPEFRVSRISSDLMVTKTDMQKRGIAILVFVSSTMSPQTISWVLGRANTQAHGTKYVVCDGPIGDCASTIEPYLKSDAEAVEFLYDRNGELAAQFGIEAKPSIVIMNELGYIARAGHGRVGTQNNAPARSG